MKNGLLLACLLLPSWAWSLSDKVKTLRWGELEVVWLENHKLPTFDITFYFADGAGSDQAGLAGATQMMFSGLNWGTNRYSQKEINDNLEFYGVGLGSQVTHEFSTVSYGGLIQHLIPVSKKVCHLLSDSIYPKDQRARWVKRSVSALQNAVTSHQALADRVFRAVSLQNTPYARPAEGTIKSLKKIRGHHLRQKLRYFNQRVQKRIYLAGPPQVLQLKDILLKDCGWGEQGQKKKGSANFSRAAFYRHQNKKVELNPQIYLVPVPQANQAQIRIGRVLQDPRKFDDTLLSLASSFLGGGFTSQLMQEVRVKRGLTYSVGAYASTQASYGRAGISTFTKNLTLGETIKVVQEVISQKAHKIEPTQLEKTKNYLAGNFLFSFERDAAFLGHLNYFDHVERPYTDLYQFPQEVRSYPPEAVSQVLSQVFGPQHQTMVVVGAQELLPQLKTFGKVKILNYKNFL